MTHFDYDPKGITENELLEKNKELYENSSFKHGDVVRMKGLSDAPILMVTEINIKTATIMYNKYQRNYISATCEWFNKSKQDFSSKSVSVLCLQKVE